MPFVKSSACSQCPPQCASPWVSEQSWARGSSPPGLALGTSLTCRTVVHPWLDVLMELHALDFSLALTRDNPSNHRGLPFAHTQHQRGYFYLSWLWHSLTSFPKSDHRAWWKDASTPAGGCGGCLGSFGGECGTGFKIENIHNFLTQ